MRLMSPFLKNFFEGAVPPDSGYKKALLLEERCSLGYLVISFILALSSSRISL